MKCIIVVAHGPNREIGNKNKLLWHIPEDLKHFKKLTMGKYIVMGRKTFDSIVEVLGRPLPGRTSVVITGTKKREKMENVFFVDSFSEAVGLSQEHGQREIYVAGGGQIYEQALPFATDLYITLVEHEGKEADTFFPRYELEKLKEISRKKLSNEAVLIHYEKLNGHLVKS